MVPSGPNRGPGAIRTPAAGATLARSVANGPGNRTQSDAPPPGRVATQFGRYSASMRWAASAPVARRARCSANTGSGWANSSVTTSCSITGPAMSPSALAAANRRISGAAARIQPTRSPPQNDLDTEPSDSTLVPSPNADNGGGSGSLPGNGMSRNDSSASTTVPDRLAA